MSTCWRRSWPASWTGPTTCWCRPPSWSPAWTSRTRTPCWWTGPMPTASPSCTSCAAGWAAAGNAATPTSSTRRRSRSARPRTSGYFLYPPEKPLSETAHERLATVAQHTELGAGMYVALKDLEIRGAGNLLGGEQSAHVAGVGFDLYVRMIGEAVSELKGAGPAERPEVRVELPV